MRAFDVSIYDSPARGNGLRERLSIDVETLANTWAPDNGAKDRQPLLHFAKTKGLTQPEARAKGEKPATKSGANTVARTAVVLDLDRLEEGGQDCGDYDPTDECRAAGWECLIEESYSSKPGHRKWHVIIPLSEPVKSPDVFHATTMEAYSKLSAQPDRTSATFSQALFQLPEGRDYIRRVLQGRAIEPVEGGIDVPRRRDTHRKACPLTLNGAPGAWNRLFSAEDRIEAGAYPYTPAPTQGQMKWRREGHASRHHLTLNHHDEGGELLYDWQEDSPTYGTIMSLWDFEREWLFGVHAPEIGRENLDADVSPGTPPNKRPSQKAMKDYAMQFPEVVEEIRAAQPTPEMVFGQSVVKPSAEPDDDSIAARFGLSVAKVEAMLNAPISSKTGLRSAPTPQDLVTISLYDPEVGLYAKSGLDGTYGWAGQTSFVPVPDKFSRPREYREFQMKGLVPRDDGHDVRLAAYLAQTYHYESFSTRMAKAVMDSRASDPLVVVNPLRDELERYLAAYDPGAPSRMPELLYNLDQSEDREFALKLIRRWLIAMCRRATTDPGLNFHQVLCLVGPGGAGKSSFFEFIAGGYLTNVRSMNPDKDGLMAMHQSMVCLKDEGLDSFTGKEWDTFKDFVAAPADRYRVPYAQNSEWHPRGFVFGATGNNPEFITRKDGSRRLWILRVESGHENEVYKVLTPELREAVLGEAMYLARHSDEPLWLEDVDDRKFAAERENTFTELGPLDEFLEEYLQSEHVHGYPFVDYDLDTPGAKGGVPEYVSLMAIQRRLATDPVLAGTSARDIRESLRRLGSSPSRNKVNPPRGIPGVKQRRAWTNPFFEEAAPSPEQLFN